MKKLEYLTAGIFGGLAYCGLELLWRGHTHWTMLMAGGLCFALIYRISALSLGIHVQCLLSCLCITAVELAVGVVVNLLLGLQVWDYSNTGPNILGQVCLLYSFLWLLLSAPCIFLARLLRRLLCRRLRRF